MHPARNFHSFRFPSFNFPATPFPLPFFPPTYCLRRSSFIVFYTYSRNLMEVQFAVFSFRQISNVFFSSSNPLWLPLRYRFIFRRFFALPFCLLAALSAGRWLRITYESSLWFCNVAGRYERTGWGLLEEREIYVGVWSTI